jgi:para-aminobenzoate synthetase component 1
LSAPYSPDAGQDSQEIPCQLATAAVAGLAQLSGFVCLGPAPGLGNIKGTTWISALPHAETDPSLSLQANLERLRQLRFAMLAHSQASSLPALVGALHYEAAYFLTAKLAPLVTENDGGGALLPFQAALYNWCLEIDHDKSRAVLSFHRQCPAEIRKKVVAIVASEPPQVDNARIGPFNPLQNADDYKASVARIRAYIQAGDCYQANLSQQFEAAIEGSGWAAYQALSRLFPTPQSAFVAQAGSEILSLSPEIFLNVERDLVETRPIKGTRPRGTSPEKDTALARELEHSAKDRAENLMIVDLLRNDLGRLCKTGSITVDALFKLESYANVHHLVSTVKGQLRDDVDALDALLGCFPGGSITGAPKIRAMEIIAELEPHRRGPYCGSVFHWDGQGNLRSNIAIRTLWRQGNRIRCWGGGGIVHDSDPEAEYAETLTKVRLLMETLEVLGRAGGTEQN